MKSLLFDWTRIKTYLPDEGKDVFNFRLVYICNVRENLIVNVWRVASWWQWVIIGYAKDALDAPLILKQGGAPTKNEAQWRAEQVLANAGLRPKTLWESRTDTVDPVLQETRERLPF